MKKNDKILAACVLAVAIIALAILALIPNDAASVRVTVDGKVVCVLPLDADTEYVIEGRNGGTNTLTIKNGVAYITEASCPDHICIYMGRVTVTNVVTCLPNGVVVELTDID